MSNTSQNQTEETLKIAIVEDDITFRGSLEIFFQDYKEYEVQTFKNAKEALEVLNKDNDFDLIITDINMPKMNGLEMLTALYAKNDAKKCDAIIITGNQSMQYAIEAIKLGVKDFIIKGEDLNNLILSIKRIVKEKNNQNIEIKKKSKKLDIETFNIKSKALERSINQATKIAPADINVLLLGESGVGKEVFAKYIHKNSNRSNAPFVAINMTTLGDTLESQLFGHVKGAFTDASEDKKGFFEVANGGSLFLDEIGDMPLNLQAKLLRAIQEKEIIPLGSTKPIKIDVRFISATNSAIHEQIKEKKFREDLFYRLSEIDIHIPPLRERKEEIIPLANRFVEDFDSKKSLDKSAQEMLLRYDWHGNIRELIATIKRAIVISETNIIKAEDLCLEGKIKATT